MVWCVREEIYLFNFLRFCLMISPFSCYLSLLFYNIYQKYDETELNAVHNDRVSL